MFSNIFNKLPNWLTLFRVLIVPIIIGIFYLPDHVLSQPHQNILATVLFTLAGITDWLDGYIARRFNMDSPFGAFLDPVADKLLVCSTLIALVELNRINAFIALIIIGREIAISALREWMAILKKRVRVSNLGKVKTTFQMLGIGFLLYYSSIFGIPSEVIVQIGEWLIFAAAILTIISMVDYLYHANQALRNTNLENDKDNSDPEGE